MNAQKRLSITRTGFTAIVLLLLLQIFLGSALYEKPVHAEALPLQSISQTPTSIPRLVTPKPTFGPTPTRFPTLSNFNTYASNLKLYLSQFDYSELILDFPEAQEVYVRLPDQWQVKATSTFTLHYTLYDQAVSIPDNGMYDGLYEGQYGYFDPPGIKIYVNDYLASTFTPQVGKDQFYTFELPGQVVDRISNNTNNEFNFRFEFVDDHDFYCGYIGTLTIHEDSSFNINFDFLLPSLDLSRFPSPISQNSSLPETIYFIVPDNFSGSDLSAAATTAAMINKSTVSKATYQIVRESDRLGIPDKANVVIVGTPSRNAFLRDVLYRRTGSTIGMPSSLGTGNRIYVNSADRFLSDNEGLVQLMQSIKDPHYSYMIITGNTDVGVELAALGLSSPPIGQVGAGFIVGANFKIPEYKLDNVIALKALGFKNTTFYGNGTYVASIPFYVPRNWKMEDGTAFVLRYRNSNNLDETNSALAIYINDQPVQSIKVDVKTPGEKEVSIPIEKSDIKPGWLNILRIEATSDMLLVCRYNPRAYLINIQETSLLYLPHSLITDPEELASIGHPIYYMGSNQSLFVSMPSNPSKDDLDMLMSFASMLGSVKLPTVEFNVSIDPIDELKAQTGTNILVIGRPTTNPHLAEINAHLPQKFVNNSDTLEQMVGNIAYQIPPGVSIGVMQALTSPFDSSMGLTLISGTTQEGQQYVYKRLIQWPPNLFELTGDLIFIGDKTVKAVTTVKGMQVALDIASSSVLGTQIALEAVPGDQITTPIGGATEFPKYVSTVETENPVGQMLGKYLLVGLLAGGGFVLILAIIQTSRGGRRS